MRSGIRELDMNMLLDDSAGKGTTQKKLPFGKRDENEDFVLFEEKDLREEPKEAERTASSGSFGKGLHQSRSDNMARAMGVGEDVFDSIERDYEESIRRQEDDEEEKWQDFGKIFAKENSQTTQMQLSRFGNGTESKTEEESGTAKSEEKYLPPLQRANIQRSNNMYNAYKSGEEWLMSEGGDNLVKGFINRFRSAPGEAIEDFAYLLYDLIPEDADGKLMRWLRENAVKVADNNTAGQIGNRATEQFDSAKEGTGYIGDRLIDAADATASMLSYGTFFGPSNLALSQSAGGGMSEYRSQRENGADKSEALTRGGLTGLTSYAIERLGGLGADNSVAPKVKLTDVSSVLNTILKTAGQEGGEEFAEYTVNSFTDALADAMYRGEVTIDWNFEDAINQAVTGAIVGGELAASPMVNGRDIDIVDEMNKIIDGSDNIETRAGNARDLKKFLGSRKKAKQELDKLLWYLGEPKAKGVNGVTRNAWGHPVIEVEHSTVFGAPNSITQKLNSKGGMVRNYYNPNSEQYKQISNNSENHSKNNLDVGGIHAHNYYLNQKGIPTHGNTRRMKTWEILENEDIL